MLGLVFIALDKDDSPSLATGFELLGAGLFGLALIWFVTKVSNGRPKKNPRR